MKTAVIAAAVLGAMVSSVYAQTNVQIYGLVDTSIVFENGGPKGSATKLESGVANGSRIGFRGTEDLGGGMSAIFTLENGFLTDTGGLDQGGLLFGRQAFVGLQGGFGQVTLGRQYTPIYKTLTAIDPFENNYGGAAGQLMSGEKAGVRQNNAVMYASPDVGGFSGQLAYGFGEVAGNNKASRQVGASAGYAARGLTLKVGYNQTYNATATDSARNTLAMAKYDFGFLIAGLGIGVNKGLGTIDSRDYIGAVTVPFAPTP